MDKTAIKNFSIWARNTLMNDVRTRLGMIGITENGINSPLPASTREIQYFDVGSTQPSSITGGEITIRDNIVSRLRQDKDYSIAFKNLIENTASSWFNRLIAIRFMEVNDYFDDGLRVLSSSTGLRDPDLLVNPFDSDLDFTERERTKVRELMNDNKMDDLFRLLLFKRCNQLHKALPGLFERNGDSSEFLIKISYIDREGMIYHLVNDISEEDWRDQVQIIGWMYQYYNSELKDETFAKKGKILKEEIPAVTQLFTPDWIVRYMVENSLGRLWVEGHPEDNHLKENWKYYLEEADQEPDVQKQLQKIRHEYSGLQPEDLTFIESKTQNLIQINDCPLRGVA